MLKQLRLSKEIEMKRLALKKLEERSTEIQKRNEEIKKGLDEAKTDEDLQLLDDEINKLETESTENDANKKTIESEIEKLETELSDVEERAKNIDNNKKRSKDGEGTTMMNRLQVRELLKNGEYYKRSEVMDFYDQFKNLRAVTGGELTVPEIVVSRIMDIMGDLSTLYPLVDKIQVKGTTRILIDTDTAPATWVEQPNALPVADTGTIASLDFDGFKVGKVTFVDNYLLQDSVVNLDAYVTKKIARAIALALDIAILRGTGDVGKQPTGIIPQLTGDNLVTVTDAANIGELVAPIGAIDTGNDSVGEIIAVMKRSTYYRRFLPYSIQVNDAGAVVGQLPNLRQPDLLGLRVVFNNNMDEDTVLYGDFTQYVLIERENIVVESSTHIRFTEDQTAFRGKGRFDGKPVKPEAFALVTIETTPAV